MAAIERIDKANPQLPLDDEQDAENDERGMQHDPLELWPDNRIDEDEQDHHRRGDPRRRPRGEEARDQHACHQGMSCLETDPGRKSERQATQLKGEQANDAGEEGDRKQQDGIL